MRVTSLDHLVLTVEDISRTVDFYTRLLGMEAVTFGGGRTALKFGSQKINLHKRGWEFEPKAKHPTTGSADLCFIVDEPIGVVVRTLKEAGIEIEEGPVHRIGATGPIESVYIRDPDGNLLEFSRYVEEMGGSSTKMSWGPRRLTLA